MLWEFRDGNWVFTPNPNYFVMIRRNKDFEEYLVEIWKKSGIVMNPEFLIGRYNTTEEVRNRIEYVLNRQYADLRTKHGYEAD